MVNLVESLIFNSSLVLISISFHRLRVKEKDLSTAENRLMSAESQVHDLQARLNDAVNQRRHWEDEYNVSLKIVACCLQSTLVSCYCWNYNGEGLHGAYIIIRQLEVDCVISNSGFN